MEGGRGKNGQVVLVGTELFRLRTVWEGLGVQLRVADHFLEFGVVECAMDSGVDVLMRWRWGAVGPMGGRVRGHRVVGEGPLAGLKGSADLLQGGVEGGPWGPWGELCGLWSSRDVTGHVGRFVVRGYPRGFPIRWRFSRRGHNCWSRAIGSPCGSQRAGW